MAPKSKVYKVKVGKERVEITTEIAGYSMKIFKKNPKEGGFILNRRKSSPFK